VDGVVVEVAPGRAYAVARVVEAVPADVGEDVVVIRRTRLPAADEGLVVVEQQVVAELSLEPLDHPGSAPENVVLGQHVVPGALPEEVLSLRPTVGIPVVREVAANGDVADLVEVHPGADAD